MKKMNKWAVSQIKERGGIPCLSTTSFYRVGKFHVAVIEMTSWDKDSTMVMVVYNTVMSCWFVSSKEDKAKTEKILDALASNNLEDCTGLGIDDVIEATKEETNAH